MSPDMAGPHSITPRRAARANNDARHIVGAQAISLSERWCPCTNQGSCCPKMDISYLASFHHLYTWMLADLQLRMPVNHFTLSWGLIPAFNSELSVILNLKDSLIWFHLILQSFDLEQTVDFHKWRNCLSEASISCSAALAGAKHRSKDWSLSFWCHVQELYHTIPAFK